MSSVLTHGLCTLSLVILLASIFDVGPLDKDFLANAGGLLVPSSPLIAATSLLAMRFQLNPLMPAVGSFFAYGAFALAALPENRVSELMWYDGFLSPEECRRIIAAAESHGAEEGWTSKRHGGLSTEDVPLTWLRPLNLELPATLSGRLGALASQRLSGHLEPIDSFVVRYSEGRQTALRPHYDGEDVTYSIVLSDPSDYEGSGVSFARLEGLGPLRLPQGALLLHPAKVLHESAPLVRGTRYLLISFNRIRSDSWRAGVRRLFDLQGLMAWTVLLRRSGVDAEVRERWPWPEKAECSDAGLA